MKNIFYRGLVLYLFLSVFVILNSEVIGSVFPFVGLFMLAFPVASVLLIFTAPKAKNKTVKMAKSLFGGMLLAGFVCMLLPFIASGFCTSLVSPRDISGCSGLFIIFGLFSSLAKLGLEIGLVGFLITNWQAFTSQSIDPKKQKYRNVVTFVFLSSLVILLVCNFFNNDAKMKQVGLLRDTPPEGFLVPTQQSLPEGVREDFHEFTNSSMLFVYFIPYRYSSFRIYETKDPDFTYKSLLRTELDFGAGSGGASSTPFVFRGSEGVIFRSIPNTDKSLVNYTLLWNDGGYGLTISLGDVPVAKFASSSVMIGMLNTFVPSSQYKPID